MNTSIVLAIVLLFQSTKVEMPPDPDFKQRVDYIGWARRQAQGTAKDSENAEPLYQAIRAKAIADPDDLAISLGFLGPITDVHNKQPTSKWDPKDHPDWEAAYHKTAAIVKAFEEAAKRPYVSAPPIAHAPEDCEQHLMLSVTADLSLIRALAKGAIEHAFRAPDGKIDAAAHKAAVASVLRASRQVERAPFVISALVGSAMRAMAYQAVNNALAQGLLTDTEIIALRDLLNAEDKAGPTTRYWLRSEYAGFADFMQLAAAKDGKLPCPVVDDAKALKFISAMIEELRGGKRDARAELSIYKDVVMNFAKLAERPYSATTLKEMDALNEPLKGQSNLVSLFMPKLSRAYELTIRSEATRRATRLILEIHIYREKNKAWPKSLNDLPREVAEKFGTDPFATKAFAYKVNGDDFLLYSDARNAVDDGGKHDKKWGDDAPDSDYVFWPVVME